MAGSQRSCCVFVFGGYSDEDDEAGPVEDLLWFLVCDDDVRTSAA